MGRSCHLLWALPLLLASACGAREDVIAEVGRNAIAVEAFQSYLEAVTGVRWQAVEERVASRLLDQFLDQEVVLTAAEDRRSVVPAVDPAARSAATRSLLREVCGTAPTVPDAAIEEEVARRMEVRRPARARVRSR
mgnify:CR=1 FL=1